MKTQKTDVATLIELLKMAAERWARILRPNINFRSTISSLRFLPYWKCGQKPSQRALAWEQARTPPW